MMLGRPTNRLGRYEIIREIARSNDIVYEGWDEQTHRRVAIKTLQIPTGATDAQRSDRISRFNREARATARLHHPNIVTLYDFGEEEGTPYLVFEYIDGPTLADVLLQKGPLSPILATEYSFQLLSALEYAHAKGVVHRDIKPSNLFICEGDKLMAADLGIARIESEATVTTDGQVFGTPAYMAPEQVRGKDLDRRVDIWACGVVLFQMVTGVQPFRGGSVIEIGSNVLNTEPNFDLIADSRIRRVTKQALSKEPASRYQTAAAMIRGLCSSSVPPIATADPLPPLVPATVPVGQPTSLNLAVAKGRGIKPILGWGLASLAGAVLGAGLVTWSSHRAPDPVPATTKQAPISSYTPKSIDDMVSEAMGNDSLRDLVTSYEFRRMAQGAQQDQLDTWSREQIGRDYMALDPDSRTRFLSELMNRYGSDYSGFPDTQEAFMKPSSGIAHLSPSTPSFFDVGSTEATVLKIEGKPDQILYRPGLKELHYGTSYVLIADGRVIDIRNSGNLKAPVRVSDNFVYPANNPPSGQPKVLNSGPVDEPDTSPAPAATQPAAATPTQSEQSAPPPDQQAAPSSAAPSAEPSDLDPSYQGKHIYPDQRAVDLDDLDVLRKLNFQAPFQMRKLPGGVREYTNATGVVRIR